MQVQKKSIDYWVLLCVISLLASTCFLNRKTKECQKLQQKILVQETNSKTLHKVLRRNMTAILHSDGFRLKESTSLYKYNAGQKTEVPIQKVKNQVVLFVPKQSCNVCYDEIYDALLYARDSLNYDIVTITEKEKYNEVKNLISDLGFQSAIYYLAEDTFWNSIKIQYAPFFGFVENRFICNHCFVPLVNYPGYSYLYLQTMQKKANKAEPIIEYTMK